MYVLGILGVCCLLMIFLFPFSVLSIRTAMTVTLMIKTGKGELLKKETERIHFAFYAIL